MFALAGQKWVVFSRHYRHPHYRDGRIWGKGPKGGGGIFGSKIGRFKKGRGYFQGAHHCVLTRPRLYVVHVTLHVCLVECLALCCHLILAQLILAEELVKKLFELLKT